MRYYDKLPPDCPPEDAEEITKPIKLYRLVKTLPPSIDDFKSYRTLRPLDDFGPNECKANGLSVYTRRSSAENRQRTPDFRDHHVCELDLNVGAGKLEKTGGAHRTWWPFAGYFVKTDVGTVQL